MSKPTLSLIVPVYNVAPYLPRCLESLAALCPPADEIIVVDDGSTDNCPKILEKFRPLLPQMHIVRQENGGLSAARNTGLGIARGTYLAFVDSDDFVEPDAYVEALRLAETDGLDMVLFNADYHFEGRQPDRPIYSDLQPGGVVSGKEWLRMRLKSGRLLHMVWMHLYRREFIESHGFRFIPRLIHEDVIWTTRALLFADRLRYLPKVSVHYRIPIRHSTPEARQTRLETVVDSSIVNTRTQSQLAQETRTDPELYRLLSHHLVDGALSIFHLLKQMPDRRKARSIQRKLRHSGVLGLLWSHSVDWAHSRRVARQWLKSLI